MSIDDKKTYDFDRSKYQQITEFQLKKNETKGIKKHSLFSLIVDKKHSHKSKFII